MEPSDSFKGAFLQKFMMNFRAGDLPLQNLTFLERKNAIKLSADAALASARGGRRKWSRALISNLVKQGGRRVDGRGTPAKRSLVSSKRIVKMSRRRRRMRRTAAGRIPPSAVARVVRERARRLKVLIPGGEAMDGLPELLDEAVDYMISLKAQIDVLRGLAESACCV